MDTMRSVIINLKANNIGEIPHCDCHTTARNDGIRLLTWQSRLLCTDLRFSLSLITTAISHGRLVMTNVHAYIFFKVRIVMPFTYYILLLTMFSMIPNSYLRSAQSDKQEKHSSDDEYRFPFAFRGFRDNKDSVVEISKEIDRVRDRIKVVKAENKPVENKDLLDGLEDRAEFLEKKLKSGTAEKATKNFIIQTITDSKWDNIRDVDFGDKKLSWSDIASSIRRGVEIQVASSLGKGLGKEIDAHCKSLIGPVFNGLKQGCTTLYQVVFKGSKMPFQSQEVMYWSESIIHSLKLLLESSTDIAGYEDRDRQQRHRNLMLRSISFEGDDQASHDAQATPANLEKGESTHRDNFATMMIYRCVLPQIDRVVEYMIQRRAYYSEKAGTSTVDGQVRDLSAVICHALGVLRQEIAKHSNLKDLASPEFKAVLPHYIRYIDELFRLLAQLVKGYGEHVEKRSLDDQQHSYSYSSREGYRHASGYQLHGI